MTFLSSSFPAVVASTDFDVEMYNRIVDSITDLAAALAGISDGSGNIILGASKAIEWGSVSKMTWASSRIQVDRFEVLDDPLTYTGTLSPALDCNISNDLTMGAGASMTLTNDLTVVGDITIYGTDEAEFGANELLLEQVAEPPDPADDKSVMWLSNGTGIGDAGDLMIKIQFGSVVKNKTLIDFA